MSSRSMASTVHMHARIGGGKKTDQRHEQQGGVELLRAVGLHEGVLLFVEGLGADFGVDGVAERLPLFDGAFVTELFGEQNGAIEGDPGHHLGIGEVLRAAAGFPDALVGVLPDGLEVFEE